jgi:hypothetical protein
MINGHAALARQDPFKVSLRLCLCAALMQACAGCGSPSKANIELRKQNQVLLDQIQKMNSSRDADWARIRALEAKTPALATLPPERLDKLFTTHGLRVGRLTAGSDTDPSTPGDEGLAIYVVPTDSTGEPIKAAGSFVVEAFDLAATGDNRVGRWEFPVEQAQKNWFGRVTQYTYILNCPWQHGPPSHTDLTVRVTFTDELTGRLFNVEKVIKVNVPPPASSPSPATSPR